MHSLVFELSIILISTAVLCTIAEFTRQPLILAYIFAGIILGPEVLGIIPTSELFTAISELGIVLLLYLIGLELKPRQFLPTLSKTAVIAFGALISTAIFGALLFFGTSLSFIQTFYLTVALFFSSTVVVMHKIIETKHVDHKVFDACLGILLIQDILAIVVLLILNSTQISGEIEAISVGQFFIYGIGVIFLSWFLQKWLLRVIIRKIKPESSLILLIGLAWCFFFAELAEVLNLSREIGAFIAGLAITSLPEHKQKIFVAKSETIRDFFMVFFFFLLGANFQIAGLMEYLPVIVLSILFVIILKPLIYYYFTKFSDYEQSERKEISLRLGQISEFSIIVAALGVQIGQISNQFMSVIHAILFVTLIASGYIVQYGIPHKMKEPDSVQP